MHPRANNFAYWTLATLCVVILALPYFFLDRFGVFPDLSVLRLLKFLAAAVLGVGVGVALTAGAGALAGVATSKAIFATSVATTAVAVATVTTVYVARQPPAPPQKPRLTLQAGVANADTSTLTANTIQTTSPAGDSLLADAGDSLQINSEGELTASNSASDKSAAPAPAAQPSASAKPKPKPQPEPIAQQAPLPSASGNGNPESTPSTANPSVTPPPAKAKQLNRLDLRKYGYPVALGCYIKGAQIDVVQRPSFDYTFKPRSTDLQWGTDNPFLLILAEEEQPFRVNDLQEYLKRDRSIAAISPTTVKGWRVVRVIRKGRYSSTSEAQTVPPVAGKSGAGTMLEGYTVEYLLYQPRGGTGENILKLYSPYVYRTLEDAKLTLEWSVAD
jgi:hypothetical protein